MEGGGSLTTTVYPIPSNKIYSISNETTKNEINNVTYSYVTIDNDFSITEREDNAYNLCYYDIVLFDRRTQQFKLFDPKHIDDFRQFIKYSYTIIELNDITNSLVYCEINNKRFNFYTYRNFGDYKPIMYFCEGYDIDLLNVKQENVICDKTITYFESSYTCSCSLFDDGMIDYDVNIIKSDKSNYDVFIKVNNNYPSNFLYLIDHYNQYNKLKTIFELENNECYFEINKDHPIYYYSFNDINYLPNIYSTNFCKYKLSKHFEYINMLDYIEQFKSKTTFINVEITNQDIKNINENIGDTYYIQNCTGEDIIINQITDYFIMCSFTILGNTQIKLNNAFVADNSRPNIINGKVSSMAYISLYIENLIIEDLYNMCNGFEEVSFISNKLDDDFVNKIKEYQDKIFVNCKTVKIN